MDLELDL